MIGTISSERIGMLKWTASVVAAFALGTAIYFLFFHADRNRSPHRESHDPSVDLPTMIPPEDAHRSGGSPDARSLQTTTSDDRPMNVIRSESSIDIDGITKSQRQKIAPLMKQREKELIGVWQHRQLTPAEKNLRSEEIHREYEKRIKAIVDE